LDASPQNSLQPQQLPENLTPFLTRPDLIRAEIERRRREREHQHLEERAEAVRIACRGSLAAFIREAWSQVEPGTRLIWNWHLDALCLHLEAVTHRKINRLLINIPPGTMKSLVVSVFWPAWEWGPAGMPHLRYVSTSYNERFVTRDTRRMRDLVESEWYRFHWTIELKRRGETSFENTATGFREGYMFTSLTGGRGNRVIIDDPHSTEGAESDADRLRVVRIFNESVPSRLNDLANDAIVVVMQRLHERDVSGEILSKPDLGYVHLCIPMRLDEDHPHAGPTPIWHDPRTEPGELLFPAKFPPTEVAKLETSLGSFGTAGQLQQRPVPRGGGLFKRDWFDGKVIAELPLGVRVVARTRAWDLAATKKQQSNSPSATAGVRMVRLSDGRFVIEHAKRMFETAGIVRAAIETTADADDTLSGWIKTRVRLPQDPGQAGKSQAQQFVLALAGHDVVALPPTGDKETRARPFSVQCEAGNVYLLAGEWVDAWLDEVCAFPNGVNDDQVDASADAFNDLALRSSYNLENL
jgi:predicted phage terminase large subunit-like protein